MRWRSTFLFTAFLGAGIFIGMLVSAESSGRDNSPVAPREAVAQTVRTAPAPVQQGLNTARDLSSAFQWVADQVTPSVVTIESEQTVTREMPEMPDFFPHEFFPRQRGEPEEFKRQGSGSGVIVSADGYIITNNHVVEDAEKITVLLGDDEDEVEAEVIGTDPYTDIAVLKVDRTGLPAIRVGDSDELRVGNWVLAIGSPFGANLQHTVTAGIVSALNRSIGLIRPDVSANYPGFEAFIQTDAAINPGNSGGALVNVEGELVGINTAISSTTGANAGIGFAIPVKMARQVMNQLIADGRVRRGYLGVEIRDVTSEFRDALGLPNKHGAFIESVQDDTPASEAGLKSRDVIREINGEPIRDVPQLRYTIASTPPGQEIILGVWRDGRMVDVPVTLQELPSQFREQPAQVARADEGISTRLGIRVRDLSNSLAERFGYQGRSGVLVTEVRSGSQAADEGIRQGDLIEEINLQKIDSVDDFGAALEDMDPGQAVMLLVRRGERSQFYGLRIPKD